MAQDNTQHQRLCCNTSHRSFSRREFLKAASLAGLGLAAASCAPQAEVEVPTPTIEPTRTLAPTPTEAPTLTPSPTLSPMDQLCYEILMGNPETLQPISVDVQIANQYPTDLAGTHLQFQEDVGPTGIVLVNDYEQVIGVVTENGEYQSFAEAFNPEEFVDPDGIKRFDAAQTPDNLKARLAEAPDVFNRGRKEWSTELNRIAYVDENDNYTGVFNSPESNLKDEDGKWVEGPIKGIGWGNVLFILGNQPEYNQAVVVTKEAAIDPDGGELIANAIRGCIGIAYRLKQSPPTTPDGYMDSFTLFTSGRERDLFSQKSTASIYGSYTYTGGSTTTGEGIVQLNKPIIIMTAKRLISSIRFNKNANIANDNGQLTIIERNTYYKNLTTDEPLTHVLVALANDFTVLFFGRGVSGDRYNNATANMMFEFAKFINAGNDASMSIKNARLRTLRVFEE